MERSEILEKVKDIVADTLGIGADKIDNDSHLSDNLGADSLDAVEIMQDWNKSLTSIYQMKMRKKY